ncbi:uncharacterized protein LOC112558989 [Pomacea canaliculata]|uniref:uncharacterized protein LOC112558989 n=1 Tax=Pomacea canaliculata TaxID=400727 RepID=UPI000D734FE4|nr:uncharacterized protein LOC112558989 [Pomacea canaliculata]
MIFLFISENVDAEPATADSEPATADAEPTTADTEPATADEEPAAVSIPSIEEQLSKEKEKNKALEERIRQLEQHVQTLESSSKIEKFGLERYAHDDAKIQFYTGFPSYKVLKIFYMFLEPHAKGMYQAYGKSGEKLCMRRPNGNMQLIDELFMFLVRLRLGLLITDLSDRFAISASSVSTKINAWANFLYTILGSMNIWLSREEIDEYMPDDFKATFPKTRIIVDCTELFMQNPSSLVRSSQFYSNYKGQATLKSLIGISPHGSVTFVSKLYSGSMSDSEITQLSGLIDLLEPGDSVMSDKGFNIQNILAKKNISLNMPAFLSGKGQFSESEVTANQSISSLRVHVERAIRRVKEYRLFHGKIPLTLCGSLNQLWTVAVLLTNFNPPLVTKYAPNASDDPDQEM